MPRARTRASDPPDVGIAVFSMSAYRAAGTRPAGPVPEHIGDAGEGSGGHGRGVGGMIG